MWYILGKCLGIGCDKRIYKIVYARILVRFYLVVEA